MIETIANHHFILERDEVVMMMMVKYHLKELWIWLRSVWWDLSYFQITGQYSVALPDGRIQTVTYSVRPETGYVVSGWNTITQTQKEKQTNQCKHSRVSYWTIVTHIFFSGWSDLHWRSILWSRRWRWWWSPSWIRSWQIKTSDPFHPVTRNQNRNWIRRTPNPTSTKLNVPTAKSTTRHRHRVSNWH